MTINLLIRLPVLCSHHRLLHHQWSTPLRGGTQVSRTTSGESAHRPRVLHQVQVLHPSVWVDQEHCRDHCGSPPSSVIHTEELVHCRQPEVLLHSIQGGQWDPHCDRHPERHLSENWEDHQRWHTGMCPYAHLLLFGLLAFLQLCQVTIVVK